MFHVERDELGVVRGGVVIGVWKLWGARVLVGQLPATVAQAGCCGEAQQSHLDRLDGQPETARAELEGAV